MAIHNYVINNQTRTNFRADLNNALSAIVSNNSNPIEPTTRFAYMWWADTTAGILKQRNSSNTDWVDILDLTSGASLSTGINDLTDGVSDVILLNIAIGINAFMSNTIGTRNVAVGNSALLNNTIGNRNAALGGAALFSNLLGAYNAGFGYSALFFCLGDFNSGFGASSLKNLTIGYENIAVGHSAASNIITENNTITIGAFLDSLGTNYFTMGKGAGANRVYNQFTANATWTRASDERIKKEIETNEDCGLSFINDLRTVTYKFKSPSELDPSLSEYDKDNDKPSHDKRMYGFIAQEVKGVLDKHGVKDFAGWHIDELGKDKLQGISYEMFVMPLVKSVQELSDKIQEMSDDAEIQDKRINRMMDRLEALENLTNN